MQCKTNDMLPYRYTVTIKTILEETAACAENDFLNIITR